MATTLCMPSSNRKETPSLTAREIEVLNLILEGKSSGEVAEILYLSKRTVDFHLAKIYEKLGVSNRIQALRRATELGVLSPI